MSIQFNTETSLSPFLFCQSYFHIKHLIICLIDEIQFLTFCHHFNHISFIILETCPNIIVLLVGVGVWLTTITEKETSMTNLFTLNYESMSTLFTLIWIGCNHISDSQTNTNHLLYKKNLHDQFSKFWTWLSCHIRAQHHPLMQSHKKNNPLDWWPQSYCYRVQSIDCE